MDFFEKFFKKLWLPKYNKFRDHPNVVRLAEITPYIECIVSYCSQGGKPELAPSHTFTGFSGGTLLLPEFIGYFSTVEENREVYFHLSLKASAARALDFWQNPKIDSNTGQRLEFFKLNAQVVRYLGSLLPRYPELEKQYVKKLEERFWTQVPTMREGEWKDLEALKSNDSLSSFLDCLCPCLQNSNYEGPLKDSPASVSHQQKRPTTEKRNPFASQTKRVSPEDKKNESNPVMHSFEKLETLDEYQGGYRPGSGDDELESHADALRELDLRNVTEDGETSASLYQAEYQSHLMHTPSEGGVGSYEKGTRKLSYPEWSKKKSQYLNDYCTLHEFPVLPVVDGQSQRDLFSTRNQKLISQWKPKIDRLVHEPIWIRRQKEGPEIDLDAATQYLVERFRGGNPEDRLYTRKSRQPGDVSVFFLLDQSLSTDSWIEGRRVLDVMTEAIGVSGLLFEGSIRDVQVAGTWSATRHHCSYQVLKSRKESWDAYFGRVSKIEPRGYTRMGPAIRHATGSLKNSETRRRLLVFLTDGKPTDLDHYEGTHGIYDVKKACEEAEKAGIVPYAMTIERERKSHFPIMFKNFSIVHTPGMFSEALVNLLSKVVSQGVSA